MNNIKDIFNSIKSNNWNNVLSILNKNPNLNINIPINNIYLIELILINNKLDIFNEIKNKYIYYDIYDIDNIPLLFIPIKYNYKELLDNILNNKYNINLFGLLFNDIKNNGGLNILLYSLRIKNYDICKLILDKYTIINSIDNNGMTFYHYNSMYGDINLLHYKPINKILINYQNTSGETCLHISINFSKDNLIKELLKIVNINIKDYLYEWTAINNLIFNININILKYIIENIVFDVNSQDYKGRSYLHFFILYNIYDILLLFIKKYNNKLNYNILNYQGQIPLHILLKKYPTILIKPEIIKLFINDSDLNLQDYKGNTCLYYLVIFNIWEDYFDELKEKKLDIYISNLDNKSIISLIPDDKLDKFYDLIALSYYYRYYKNKDKYIDVLNKNTSKKENLKAIKISIKKNKVSFPIKKKKICIIIEKPINTDIYVSYTGSNLDILCGLILLEKTYKNVYTSIHSNLIINNSLFKYYKSINKYLNKNNMDFYNIEIIWINQKLILPDNIKEIFNTDKRFIIIPISIEINNKFHSNILIYDKTKKIIERFEPNGANNPYGLFYNSNILDFELKLQCLKLFPNITYLAPKDYLPKIGIQIYENHELKNKKISDPDGFCSSWSLWYVYYILKYPDIPRKKLIKRIIYTIKRNNYSFKDIIRDFTLKIIKIRNKVLENTNININNWIYNNYSDKDYEVLLLNINNIIKTL